MARAVVKRSSGGWGIECQGRTEFLKSSRGKKRLTK